MAMIVAGTKKARAGSETSLHGRLASGNRHASILYRKNSDTTTCNPMIAQSAQLHWQHIRRAMGAVLQVSTVRESIWDEHEAIAKAIAAGDPDLAEALVRQHADDASRNLARLLARALKGAVDADRIPTPIFSSV